MNDFTFAVEGGQSLRLKTAGKYCQRDITVTATGGNTEDAYSQGVAHGKQAEYDSFWDNYQNYGNRRNYVMAFYNTQWNDYTYNPKYPITVDATDKGYDAFEYATITDTKVDIDYSLAKNLRLLFGYCENLKTVRKLMVNELCEFDRTFYRCVALENIAFEGKIGKNMNLSWSPLNRKSLLSCISALSDTATGMTASFKKTAVEGAFTTDEWNALVAPKSNWTITLV